MKRVVQRLTGTGPAAAPRPEAHVAAAADAGAPDSRAPRTEPDSWITSSMDLIDGAQIIEDPDDTIPAALLDELFPPPDAKTPKP